MRALLPRLAYFAPLLLASCADPAPTYIDQAWIRLNANPDSPSAGYFVAHGGDAGGQIRDVRTDYAQRVEMHESTHENGVSGMKAIDSADIPAKATVTFAPGGKHLMLWNINETAINRGKLTFTFFMANGDRLLVDAVIQKPDGSSTAAPTNETAAH